MDIKLKPHNYNLEYRSIVVKSKVDEINKQLYIIHDIINRYKYMKKHNIEKYENVELLDKNIFNILKSRNLLYNKIELIYWDYNLKKSVNGYLYNINNIDNNKIDIYSGYEVEIKEYIIRYRIYTKSHNSYISYTETHIDNKIEYIDVPIIKLENLLYCTCIYICNNKCNNNIIKNGYVINPITKKKMKIYKGDRNKHICPLEDRDDYIYCIENNIKIKNIFESCGLLKNSGEYDGYDRYICRDMIIKKLLKYDIIKLSEKLLSNKKIYLNKKNGYIVEPRVVSRWYIKNSNIIDKLKEIFNRSLSMNKLDIIPKISKDKLIEQIDNIKDFCISTDGKNSDKYMECVKILSYFDICESSMSIFPQKIINLLLIDNISMEQFGYEIILLCVEILGNIPFERIYILNEKLAKYLPTVIKKQNKKYDVNRLILLNDISVEQQYDIFINKIMNISTFIKNNLDTINKIDYSELIEETNMLGLIIEQCIDNIELHNLFELFENYINKLEKYSNLEKPNSIFFNIYITFLKILYPFMPHLCGSIYYDIRNNNIVSRPWPKFNIK